MVRPGASIMIAFLRRGAPAAVLVALVACSSGEATTSSTGSGGTSTTSGSTTSASASSGTGGTSGSVDPPPAGDTTYAAVTAAQAFLATLDATQKAAVSFAFTDDAQRTHWSNFPTGIFQRNGVKLGNMTAAQQEATFAMLAAILSPKGYQQVVDTVNADEALKQSTSGGMLVFGRDEYFVSILGTPSATSPWMVQFGGHHLAINATIVGADITLAPSLTGAQPASYVLNGATIRPQGVEIDRAFELVNALDATQKAKAVIGSMYIDLVLGPGQDGKVLAPEGIQASTLTAAQQALLLQVIADRVEILNLEDAALRMAEIKATLADTYFAWSGPTTAGSAAYYRVTGPTLAIEYSPQSLGGAATDHTHAMYRDPTNDYGKALIK
jgi:hypothetical protein